MKSRLSLVGDWPALARAARYRCENLACQCGVSDRQLERFFRAHFKQKPKQWMQSLRMQCARELLQHGYSTKAAALELCYGGSCQFCREFKKHFGQAPQENAFMTGGRVSSTKSGSVHPSKLHQA